jgi:hypothetical protein
MRVRFSVSLLVLGLCSIACSSNSTKKTTQPPPQNIATDTSTDTNTETDVDAGDIDAGNTSACNEWPPGKLMPFVGPFFYGESPRPCRVKNNAQNTSLFLNYSASGQLDTLLNSATGDKGQTKYAYDQTSGLLATATQDGSVTTYEYAKDKLTLTTVSGSTTSTQVYRLDAKGYPTVVTITPPPEGQPVRFLHEYDNCRMIKRTAFNADGSENEELTAEYEYEESTGHMKRRYAPLDDQNYYYLDDSGNCVAAK